MKTNEEKKAYAKMYREANKDKINQYRKEYYLANKEHEIKRNNDYNKTYRNTNTEYIKKYNEINKDKLKEQRKLYLEANKDKISKYRKNYYENSKLDNPTKIERVKKTKPVKVNIPIIPQTKEEINATKRAYYRKKISTDPLFKFKKNIRSSISKSIRNMGYKKIQKTEQILGCTIEAFKEYIESQFEDWMNWNNYGNPKNGIYEPNKTWDIDHIVPITSAITENAILELNHYTNLKPLCSYYNRWVKGANLLY